MSKVIQDVVLLMDPPYHAWDISLKGANMALNRFCIDEEAAFESSGVYYLKKRKTDPRFNDLEKLEFDKQVIVSACENIAQNKSNDSKIHFVYAYGDRHNYHYDFIVPGIREEMKKCKLESVLWTFISMVRWEPITDKDMLEYCLGKYDFRKGSINDDLEAFIENLRLGKITDIAASTYFLPKLQREEVNLIARKDPNYLAKFRVEDMDKDEGWRAYGSQSPKQRIFKSDVEYVQGMCERSTQILKLKI